MRQKSVPEKEPGSGTPHRPRKFEQHIAEYIRDLLRTALNVGELSTRPACRSACTGSTIPPIARSEPDRPNQHDRRLGCPDGLLQCRNPAQPPRKTAAIEERLQTPLAQYRIDVRCVPLVHTRVAHKYVVGLVRHQNPRVLT
jgi:hypothetical protein